MKESIFLKTTGLHS